jgi:low temperature requirement protein LtrA
MLLAIFAVWMSTSWSATMIRADQSRTRSLILAVMLLGLFMNAAVTQAFTISGWAFIIPFLLIQLGRAVWMIANSTDAVFRDHYTRVLLWVQQLVCYGGHLLLDWIRLAGGWHIPSLADGCNRKIFHSTPCSCKPRRCERLHANGGRTHCHSGCE